MSRVDASVPRSDHWPTGTVGGGHTFSRADLAEIGNLCNDLQVDFVTTVAERSIEREPLCWQAAHEMTCVPSARLRANVGHLTRHTRAVTGDDNATLVAVHQNTTAPSASGHRYWCWMPTGLAALWLETNGR